MCDRQAEGRIHGLCVRMFTGVDARLDGRHVTRSGGGVTVIERVAIAPDSTATAALERLVVQLTREPGVRNVSWHLRPDDISASGPQDRPVGG
ncbi:hypothetical protein ACIQU6_24075 [Streptomyces sp. NPDC090442]|uniref:hypothetical protein n=1 Tax=Streptomyces sp. NPDC090442 TaxID=3365962 RepID=UPI0038098E56